MRIEDYLYPIVQPVYFPIATITVRRPFSIQIGATRPMEQVEVKSLATKVGRIGFGCDPLGEHGWGAFDRSAMAAAIHVALDSGINLFGVCGGLGRGRAG